MADFIVTTLVDENDGGDGGTGLSLREALALANANANADADAITFDASLAGGTLTLVNGELAIMRDVTIVGDVDGDRRADITISGDANGSGVADLGDSRIFSIILGGTDAVLRSLTLTNGYSSLDGGAIYSGGATTLAVVDTTVSDSRTIAFGQGGGIHAHALSLVNSTVAGNSAGNGGGVFIISTGSGAFVNATVHGNHAGNDGGGIGTNTGSRLTILSSTIAGNSAADVGGGVGLHNGSAATIANSVVAGNTAGVGAGADVGETGTNDSTVDARNSFFGTAVVIDTGENNRNNAGDPGLGALADNGGRVMTRAVLNGSLLIDAGDAALLPDDAFDVDGDDDIDEPLPVDARGLAREVGANVDIGAFEAGQFLVTTLDDEAYAAARSPMSWPTATGCRCARRWRSPMPTRTRIPSPSMLRSPAAR